MAEYFSHDYNATEDPKLAALLQKYGYEGYGLWWGLIEILHAQGGKFQKFPAMYAGLAHILHIDQALLEQLVNSAINDFQLLCEDDNYIWSERALRNLQEREDKRQKKIEAGRKGGISTQVKSSKIKHHSSTAQAESSTAQAESSKRKESKVNKKKEYITPISQADEIVESLEKLQPDKNDVVLNTSSSLVNKVVDSNLSPVANHPSPKKQIIPKAKLDEIVFYYKTITGGDADDKWNTMDYKRNCSPAKKLLLYLDEDTTQAKAFLDFAKAYYEREALSWTFETVIKNATMLKLKMNYKPKISSLYSMDNCYKKEEVKISEEISNV